MYKRDDKKRGNNGVQCTWEVSKYENMNIANEDVHLVIIVTVVDHLENLDNYIRSCIEMLSQL